MILKLKKTPSIHLILIIYLEVQGRTTDGLVSQKLIANRECVVNGTRVGLTVSRIIIIAK